MNISFSEILLVVIVALLVIRPEQWPAAVRLTSRTLAQMRRIITSLKSEAKSLLDAVDSTHERK